MTTFTENYCGKRSNKTSAYIIAVNIETRQQNQQQISLSNLKKVKTIQSDSQFCRTKTQQRQRVQIGNNRGRTNMCS